MHILYDNRRKSSTEKYFRWFIEEKQTKAGEKLFFCELRPFMHKLNEARVSLRAALNHELLYVAIYAQIKRGKFLW